MKIRTTRNTVTAAMVFFVLSGLSAISHATIDNEEHESVRVNYADLDLENAAGREALVKRLRLAAKNVCEKHGSTTLRETTAERECKQDALNKALRHAGLRQEVAAHTH